MVTRKSNLRATETRAAHNLINPVFAGWTL